MIHEIKIGKCDRCGMTVAEYNEETGHNVFNYETVTTTRHHSAWEKDISSSFTLCGECFTEMMKWFHNPLQKGENDE